tara:strand:+ start:386 stop:853 length:468 start_codon:yes stop_codon:yes gene_type:complete
MKHLTITLLTLLVLGSCSQEELPTESEVPSSKIVNLDCAMEITFSTGKLAEDKLPVGKKFTDEVDIDFDKGEASWSQTQKLFTVDSNDPAQNLAISNKSVSMGDILGNYYISIDRNDFSATMRKGFFSLEFPGNGWGINSKGVCKIVERKAPKGF